VTIRVDQRLEILVRLLERRAVDGVGRRQPEQLEMTRR